MAATYTFDVFSSLDTEPSTTTSKSSSTARPCTAEWGA